MPVEKLLGMARAGYEKKGFTFSPKTQTPQAPSETAPKSDAPAAPRELYQDEHEVLD